MYIELLREKLGKDNVTINETELLRHSRDESMHVASKPEVVCFPKTTEEVVTILEISRQYEVPVTPFGAGSGLEGQAIPVQHGITISFEQMNQIVDFAPEDLTISVQPGVTRLQLNKYVNRHGMMFPIDPGADASIGGMTATNASGTTAVRYGSMREQILTMTIVLADGTIIKTGTKAKKSSSGYHLNGLFIGSEGTLGVITEITLKLHGIPESTVVARCTFDSPVLCGEAAQTVLLSGINVMRMEFVNANTIKRVNEYGSYDYPEKHSLFFEFAGSSKAVEEEVSFTKELMNDLGCDHWEAAEDPEARQELWRARKEMSYAFRHIKGVKAFSADVCVPISKLPGMINYASSLLEKYSLKAGIFGHVGDGNFHTLMTFDATSEEERNRALQINEMIVNRAIDVGGTCTGEHGVGLGKKKFQAKEHGTSMELMKSIKGLLDPQGLLNPGKIW
ncbi:FAD-binding oxidoreductase [Oceanobacillus halotolerans]|uniref:FAD-binding oxidoreductase n=1 Tax=Oceanobacillus halotolerans TaxID=2663380 RepID=UPI0013DCF330|nr:FAD-linked oxidase C-terminal domain-containing protein [Oceanobacillus halotolerans]